MTASTVGGETVSTT